MALRARRSSTFWLRVPREQSRPGDMVICNDPFTTGNAHAVDVGVVRPIFASGPAGPDDEPELIAWCWSEAHGNDFGGCAPGSMARWLPRPTGGPCGCPVSSWSTSADAGRRHLADH
ncbi:hydantoinase B/oxoprolinase family protein [Pseudonocardia sp. Cha107L01]|uniref:hydantoinase B/oxoprolinase family protein n=1 Tax=Pseudonocardia sp. Cha107L01 TaxID=3457576 RepID=UPI00403E6171